MNTKDRFFLSRSQNPLNGSPKRRRKFLSKDTTVTSSYDVTPPPRPGSGSISLPLS
jgi:hypothetical protein